MPDNLPVYISLTFVLTTFLTLLLFIWTIRQSGSEATHKNSTIIFIGLAAWLAIQAMLTLKNIYNRDTKTFPPKIMLLGILPVLLAILIVFISKKGRRFIDGLPLNNLTYLHIVRIPVEVVLLWLFLNKAIPQIMTFNGRNFDILAGITAPFVAYFGFTKFKISRRVILVWNFICLGLLINIVLIALLSAPLPLQKFAFEQPDVAILNFPFSWLPTFIVPVVLFSHLISIRQLLQHTTFNKV